MKTDKYMKKVAQEDCLGEYAVSVKGRDMICVPYKWRRFLKGSLYCVYCKDAEYSYLRMFFNKKSMDNFLEKINNQEESDELGKVRLVSCSLHRTLWFSGFWRLPEAFLNEDINREIFLSGVIDSFEVWKKNDWYKMTEKAEEELQGFLNLGQE